MTADGGGPETGGPGGAVPHVAGSAAADHPGDDPFGTGRLRRTILDAWRGDPSRFRQDANLEEDFGHGFYRDRLVVELAQNAADAAAAAGVTGRLLLRLRRADTGVGSAAGQRADDDATGTVELIVANTGAPLDAAGVAALASLRASGKTDGLTGRFGVGFAAVRAVSEDVTVLTRTELGVRPEPIGPESIGPESTRTTEGVSGVRFSRRRAAELLAGEFGPGEAVTAEIAARDGDLPMLRLPFPAGAIEGDPEDPGVPAGYDTAVRLRLRSDAVGPVRGMLAGVDDALLLALPALTELRVEIEDARARVVTNVAERWILVRREGRVPAHALADRPVEERRRSGWSLVWAWPRVGSRPGSTGDASGLDASDLDASGIDDGLDPILGRVHAPTPTDDPCTLPALLSATFPLDASRRRVAAGPLRDLLVTEAARAYAELVAEVAARGEADVLDAVPTGLPAGELDAELREAVVEHLRRADLLVTADGAVVSPASATMIAGSAGNDPHLLGALAGLLEGLVTVAPARRSAARTLGVAEADLAEIIERLPAGGADLAVWQRVYEALSTYVASDREALATLPVPLVDGRWSRGARATVILDPGSPASSVASGGASDVLSALEGLAQVAPGLRMVHPGVACETIESLGARRLTAATLLAEPAVREAVERLDLLDSPGPARAQSADDAPDVLPRPVSLVLDLLTSVGADEPDAGEAPVPGGVPAWLEDLPLPGEDDSWWPARDLVLPGSVAEDLLDGLVAVRQDVAARWPSRILAATGVRTDLTVSRVADVVADPDLAGEPPDGTTSPDGWEEYLDYLADVLGAGAYVGDLDVLGDLDVVAPRAWEHVLRRIATTPRLRRTLLQPVRHAVAGATGTSAEALSYTAWWLREEFGSPFAAPADSAATPPFLAPAPAEFTGLDDETLAALGAVRDLADLDEPGWHRYVQGWPEDGELSAARASILWRAMYEVAARGWELDPPAVPALAGERVEMTAEPLVGPIMWAQVCPVLPAPREVAADLAATLDLDLAGEALPRAGHAVEQPVPQAVAAVLPTAPPTWWECEQLEVEDAEVTWWVASGRCYATTGAGMARALAWAAGAWSRRLMAETVLGEPDRLTELLLESAVE